MELRNILISLCLFIVCSRGVKKDLEIPNIANYYQDLTETIDKIIIHGNESYSDELSKALGRSTQVYYSSDITMNKIMDMLPIINLLNEKKPNGTTISIMLSLRYTFQNRFSRQNYDDVFYDLSLNITADSWKQLTRHISRIVLDWNTDGCSEADYFYSKPGSMVATPPVERSFPQYIKNFIRFYCGEDGEDDCKIPVGIAYNVSQCGCADYLQYQYRYADFIVITVQFPAYRGFPITSTSFSQYMTGIKKKVDLDKNIHNSYGFGKAVYFNMNIGQIPSVAQVTSHWSWNQNNISASYNESEQIANFSKLMFWKNFGLLLKQTSKFDPHPIKYNFILGSSVAPLLSKYQTMTKPVLTSGVFVPSVRAEEDKTAVCPLALPLSKAFNGSMLVTQYAWRAMKRYENKILQRTECKIYPDGKPQSVPVGTIPQTKVSLVFENGIYKTWSNIRDHMNRLVEKYRNVGNASLNTLLFYETDISPSSQENFTEIENFIRKWDKEYETGCVVNFNGKLQYSGVKKGTVREIFASFCKPVFDILDVMIWKIGNDDTNLDYGLSGKYDEVIVARQMFLREFPEKQVILMLDYYGMDYNILTRFANLYGVPVVVPSDQIKY